MASASKYSGELFGNAKTPESQPQHRDFDKLIEVETDRLRRTYGTDCLDVKQLQQVLNVGESNVRDWIKKCPVVMVINRRKVVPVIWMAHYLVTGTI